MRETISAINTAVAAALRAAEGIVRAEDAGRGELSEGIPDLPTLQVYWQALATDAENAHTDRRTFGAGVRATQLTFHADVYARQRSHLGEDVAATLALAEAVQTVLEAQASAPFFGLDAIRALKWSAQRVTFEFGGGRYSGVRFVIDLWVY